MPTFEFTGAKPKAVKYVMDGPGAPTVTGRVFEPGEHVAASTNPDPALFAEVSTEE